MSRRCYRKISQNAPRDADAMRCALLQFLTLERAERGMVRYRGGELERRHGHPIRVRRSGHTGQPEDTLLRYSPST